MKQKTQGRVLIALVPASFVFSDYDEYAVISYSFTLRFSSWGRHTSVSSLGIVLFIAFLPPNAKGRQHTLSVFRSGVQLVYPYSTTTIYSSDAAS